MAATSGPDITSKVPALDHLRRASAGVPINIAQMPVLSQPSVREEVGQEAGTKLVEFENRLKPELPTICLRIVGVRSTAFRRSAECLTAAGIMLGYQDTNAKKVLPSERALHSLSYPRRNVHHIPPGTFPGIEIGITE